LNSDLLWKRKGERERGREGGLVRGGRFFPLSARGRASHVRLSYASIAEKREVKKLLLIGAAIRGGMADRGINLNQNRYF